MKKVIALLIVVIIAAVLVVTCPDKPAHQEVVKAMLSEKVSSTAGELSPIESEVLGALGSVVADNVIDVYLSSHLTVNNYFVCSVAEVSWQGKQYPVSVGVLNHVFTLKIEELEALEQQLKK